MVRILRFGSCGNWRLARGWSVGVPSGVVTPVCCKVDEEDGCKFTGVEKPVLPFDSALISLLPSSGGLHRSEQSSGVGIGALCVHLVLRLGEGE